MIEVTVQNKDDGIFWWFNVTNKVSEPICKDITLDPTGWMTGRRCSIHKFHIHMLSANDQKWRDLVTSRTHTGNYCDKSSTLCRLQSTYLALSF
jgi:hypothetical protein